jgi:hypothetical protein
VLILVFGAKKEKPQQPTTDTRIGHHCEDRGMLYLPSALGIAAKLGSLLSLAFVLVGRRSWLKMSDSPIGKLGFYRELFDFLSVVGRYLYGGKATHLLLRRREHQRTTNHMLASS